MGKIALLLVFGALVMGSVIFSQSIDSHQAAVEKQSVYQQEALAADIARSALNLAMAKVSAAGNHYDNAVGSINGLLASGEPDPAGKLVGTLQGGTYEVTAHTIDGQLFMVRAKGFYGSGEGEFKDYHRIPMLSSPDWSTLSLGILPGGFTSNCLSLYITRTIPATYMALDLAGNPIAGDPMNMNMPISGAVSDDGEWFVGAPEMLLPSGTHYLNVGAVYPFTNIVLPPGTQVNFIMGVSACTDPNVGVTYPNFDPSRYTRGFMYALDQQASDPTRFNEGPLAMIEQHGTEANTWRIALEDSEYYYSVQEHIRDIKANGYPPEPAVWDADNQTFGGTGWSGERDAHGYRELLEIAGIPDINDFMIEVKWNPCGGPC